MSREHDGISWVTRITSGVVILALAACSVLEKYGSVTPTPEGLKTPTRDPAHCDAHMYTANPEPMPKLDAKSIQFISEQPMGPSGVGTITELSRVENPTSDFVSNVRASITREKLGIDPNKATVIEFGMQGSNGDLCAPLVLVTDEAKANGTQRSFLGFGATEADTNGDKVGDLPVLVPAFGGKVDTFLELGEVQSTLNDGKVTVGTIDKLDPRAISPIFSVDKKTGDVEFFPPFSESKGQNAPITIPTQEAGNFVETSFNIPAGQGTETSTPAATATKTARPPTATASPTSSPTPPPTIVYSPTPGLAKTETATPTTATSTPTTESSPIPELTSNTKTATPETSTNTPQSSDIIALTTKNILLNKGMNTLEIGGINFADKTSPVKIGESYAYTKIDYGNGHVSEWILVGIRIHTPDVQDQPQASPDSFNPCSDTTYRKCEINPSQIQDWLNWYRQKYGGQNDIIVAGLIRGPKFLEAQGKMSTRLKQLATGSELDLTTNNLFGGTGSTVDPLVDAYFKSNTNIATDFDDLANTANAGYIKNAVLEILY